LPLTAHGDSDGRLQLNSDIITNRSGVGTSVSDFEIRSQLFSNALDEKMQEKARQEAEATKNIQTIDFNQDSQNKLYQTNHQNVKTALFKDYKQTNIASDDSKAQENTHRLMLLLILAVPLLILTGFVARRFARRKRR
jgi:type VII secretion protein EssA